MLLARKPDRNFIVQKINEVSSNESFTYTQVGATYNKKGRSDFLPSDQKTTNNQQELAKPQRTASIPTGPNTAIAVQMGPNGEVNGKHENGNVMSSYWVDHYRINLGKGAEVYQTAIKAVREWKMFALPWVELCYPETPIEVNSVVAVLCKNFGFWSLNFCKICYVMDNEFDEEGSVERFGFGYGTLQHHVEQGEERFMVEWNKEDDTVWYDLLSFSRPQHWLLKVGGLPVGRYFQRCFAHDSMMAMIHYVQQNTTKVI
eukprot:TRINITY_DN1462_c0_g1_i2.p1 TRINITY_DN1462_c0_g1~~TRINITY_DN1462_c0_g1_i2.p1  ORF type:complete len:259 (+),score=51.66 TRINITY_DN1462_c0_g1_i2:214-990(+)